MIRDIVILTESPLSKRDYDRFGIEILSCDFNVSVLDCTPWLKPEFWRVHSDIRHEFSGYYAIQNWQDFESRSPRGSSVIVIDYLGSCQTSVRIRKVLREWKIKRAEVHNGLLPEPYFKFPQRILHNLRKGHFVNRGLRKLKRTVVSATTWKYLPDIVIFSGEAGLQGAMNRIHHKIWAHSFDYDIYLSIQSKRRIKTAPYAVFLDEDMVHHSDYLCHGINPPTNENSYYQSLNKFFDHFSSSTNLEVIFAAHPRSRYDVRPHLLAGRQAILGKTAELVRDASLVIAHASTAVSFAVIWQKPIIFLTTNDIQKSLFQPHIDARSNFFDSSPINIDSFHESDIDLQTWSEIKKSTYKDYKRLYIKKPNTPERPLWEIFSTYVLDNLMFSKAKKVLLSNIKL